MIRIQLFSGAAIAAIMVGGALAQQPPVGPVPVDAPPPAPAPDVVAQFDGDGDGQLNEGELGRARDFMQALRRTLGDRLQERGADRERAPRRAAEGAPRRRVPRDNPAPPPQLQLGDRPPMDAEGPAGDPALPRPRRGDRRGPMATFEQFDADADGQLSRDEFLGFWDTLGGRGGPPEGRRLDGPAFGRPPGPPEGGRLRGDRDRGDDVRGDRDRGRRDGDERRGDRGRDGERPTRDADVEFDEAPPFEPEPADRPAGDPQP